MVSQKTSDPAALSAAVREAHDWCQGAIFQAARLTELLDNQVAFDHANAMAAEWRALRAANVLPGGARVEVLESYFLLGALRHLLTALAPLKGRHAGLSRELSLAAKAFAAALPTPTELRRLLDVGYSMGGADLPELNDGGAATGAALRAARERDYLLGGKVSLPVVTAALRTLAPVLGAAREAPPPAAPPRASTAT